jgi:membrane associated rhomboid family serine protease
MGPMDAAYFEAPAEGSPRLPPGRPQRYDGDEPREPLFNAPWAAVMTSLVIIVGYWLQSRFPPESVTLSYAFAPAMLEEGRYSRLLTYMFLHGGWPHALMNGAFALALGAPVARFFGERMSGTLIFFAFYAACGVVAALGYAAVHPGSQQVMVGASGAVSGLMGGTARILGGQRGGLGSALSQPVIAMGLAWLVMNLILALVGGALVPGTGGAGVAWEAHIAGFLAGVILITPFAWLRPRT